MKRTVRHLLAGFFGIWWGASLAADPFAACEASLVAAPSDLNSVRCFHQVARQEREFQEALRRVRGHLAKTPDHSGLHLILGHLLWTTGEEGAEDEYLKAAAGFRSQGETEGEAEALDNLHRLRFSRGRMEESRGALDDLLELANRTGLPQIEAQAWIQQARFLRAQGHDRESVYRLLRRAEEKNFANGTYGFRRNCLIQLGAVTYELGRYEEASVFYGRLLDLAAKEEDLYAVASARYNLANTRLAERVEVPLPSSRGELTGLFQEAQAVASRAGHTSVEMQSHRLLGNLRSAEGDRDRAEEHYRQCRGMATRLNRLRREADCLRAWAGHRIRWNEEGSEEFLESAGDLARRLDDPWVLAQLEEQRMRRIWSTASRAEAVAASLTSLEAIEDLRRREPGEGGRASLFSLWTDPYAWLVGRLLDVEAGPDRPALEQAFLLAEQLRARVLLETLDESHAAAKASNAVAEGPLHQAQLEVVGIQRRLLALDLSEDERQSLLLELERSEWSEAESMALEIPVRTPDFVTLAEVEAALSPDEVLLAYQVGLWEDVYGDFAGGSWLFSVTRGGSRAYRLPDRTRLRPAVQVFRGLVERRDGSEAKASSLLHQDLLAAALKDLPEGVERLVVVPDDDLQLLPWGALRESEAGAPLTARFHLSFAPSATVWLRLRSRPMGEASAVLALADPPAFGGPEDVAQERSWALGDGTRLGALPYARREARKAVRRAGRGSRLLLGEAAAESELKALDLRSFGLLHFATHAVVDERHPLRSAVVLAAGAESEDGLLQPRDIVGLDLEGKAVVLSTCQSATGAVLRGEGVVSLARPFLQAGASAVIGSLWPLRDDETARLFDEFYRHLARGASLETALSGAQRALHRAGAPAAAWSGLVLFGRGDWIPQPGGRSPMPWKVLLGVAVLGLGWILWRVRF